MTKLHVLQTMSDEEFAEFLCDMCVDHTCEHICAYADKCTEAHSQEFCMEQITLWLNEEAK